MTGTGRPLQHLLPEGLTVAGKTGTTNDLRDSWFAGFTNNHVAVAWVGRDDNSSTGLTGSSGALRVWAATIGAITTTPLQLQPPPNIDYYFSDIEAGKLFSDQCRQGELIPFIRGGLLPPVITCDGSTLLLPSNQPPGKGFKQVLKESVQTILRPFQ